MFISHTSFRNIFFSFENIDNAQCCGVDAVLVPDVVCTFE